MKTRSYRRIVNKTKRHESKFTTIPNNNKMPRAKRRRTKDKKPISDNKKSAIAFDEPSLSSLSANATPFKPTKILKRSDAVESKPTVPPISIYNHRKNSSETLTQHKQVNNGSFHNQMQHAPNAKNKNKNKKVIKILQGSKSLRTSPPVLPMNNARQRPSSAKYAAKPPGLLPRNTKNENKMNKNKMNKISVQKYNPNNENVYENNDKIDMDYDDVNKSIAFLRMLDSLDTDDIYIDIVSSHNNNRNYDFPTHVYGLYSSIVWDHCIDINDNDKHNREWA